MIIKSIGHKYTGAFKKLVYYILDEDKNELGDFLFTKYVSGEKTPENVILQMNQNERKRIVKRKKTSNVIYHEVISFEKRDSHKLSDSKLLKKMVRKYASLRAPNAVVCAALHTDKSHVHIHCLVTAVGIDGRNVRLSRAAFKQAKIEMEAWQDKYLKLEYSKINHGSKKKSASMTLNIILTNGVGKVTDRP